MIMNNISTFKDFSYIITFFIGLITFIKTFRKRGFCCLDYKTEVGDEVNIYIFGIKDDVFNLKILCDNNKINATKFKNSEVSKIKNERDKMSGDVSLYFPSIDKDDVIEIRHANELGKIKFKFEDRYSNKYSQFIEFDQNADLAFRSRRLYKMTKKKAHPYWKRFL